MWDGERLVKVRRLAVEYILLEPSRDKPAGQLFIGYETVNHYNQKPYIRVVRWVPGIAV